MCLSECLRLLSSRAKIETLDGGYSVLFSKRDEVPMCAILSLSPAPSPPSALIKTERQKSRGHTDNTRQRERERESTEDRFRVKESSRTKADHGSPESLGGPHGTQREEENPVCCPGNGANPAGPSAGRDVNAGVRCDLETCLLCTLIESAHKSLNKVGRRAAPHCTAAEIHPQETAVKKVIVPGGDSLLTQSSEFGEFCRSTHDLKCAASANAH
ncbi:hypothetical protein DNTS_014528 [Danionella cerebrum]|uniref:Uncharacterized protein n=1 Tax=Danionella cerebrum TaxID=2873325 RepID=A0A553QCB2_9TELE|nr:hypothetical protein DNTS_014528 [Danionella translucida]